MERYEASRGYLSIIFLIYLFSSRYRQFVNVKLLITYGKYYY